MCVIASLYLENQSILVKNRDRKYKAFVKAVHEIKNGVEVLYIQDTGTDWSEGLNEYGIGITNATLMVVQDENAGIVVKKRQKVVTVLVECGGKLKMCGGILRFNVQTWLK